jgi:hypothetical protein
MNERSARYILAAVILLIVWLVFRPRIVGRWVVYHGTDIVTVAPSETVCVQETHDYEVAINDKWVFGSDLRCKHEIAFRAGW